MSTVFTLAGLVAAGITVLYILKLRKRRIQVPFSPLWANVLADRNQTTDFWKRFRRLFSWFLHLLIAALLAFALADPHLEGEVVEGRHLLILVDSSASMGATDVSGGVNRLDVAKQKAREILSTMGPEDRVMLVTFNNQLRPLSPFVGEASLLEQPLRDIKVLPSGTSFEEAIRFAADSLRDKKRAELVILSDGAGLKSDALKEIPFDKNTTVRHLKIGEASGNLAITAFNVRRYLSNKLDYELFVGVRSYFERDVDAEIEIWADGRLVDTKPISLAAGETYQRFYPSQAVSGERLEARVRLTTPDARDVFPLDDRAYSLLPAVALTKIRVVTEGNLYLEGSLILNPNLSLVRQSPAEYDPKDTSFDVTIFDRFAPIPPATGGVLYLAPEGENSPWQYTKVVKDPIITRVKKSHPLMRWISLNDLNIGESAQWKMGKNDVVVAASALGAPILVARQEEGRRIVGLSFDIRNSDFPLRVAFPVFLLNTIDFFALQDESLVESYRAGETWSVAATGGQKELQVRRPDGTDVKVPVYDGKAVVLGEQVGFYTIRGEGMLEKIAANLSDHDESAISPASLELPQTEMKTETESLLFDRSELWIWALLLALLLLLGEWWTYNRRITV